MPDSLYKKVAAHEMGHNFGMSHDFDAKHDGDWDHKDYEGHRVDDFWYL